MTATAPARRAVPARLRGQVTPGRVLIAIAVLAATAFYLVNVAQFARQPLRIEENEWPRMARAIYETGRPFISAEDSQRLRLDPASRGGPLRFTDEPFNGVWHPPLYQYALAASMPFVGADASYALRGVGVAGMLASVVLLLLIAREVDRRRWPLIGGAGAVLLLLHPYASQGSTFLDIDTSIYGALFLLLLWLTIRYAERPPGWVGWKRLALLVAAVGLVCWAKLTTIIVVAPVIAVYWVWMRGLRRGVPEALAIIAGGAGLFFATYALWAWIVDLPFSYPFEVTFETKIGWLGSIADERQWVFRWQIAWFGPALLLLAVAYGIDAIVSLLRTRRPRPMDLLWTSGVAILVLYAWATPNPTIYQGKYALPALAMFILPVAWLCLRGVRRAPTLAAVTVAAGVALLAAINMPDLTLADAFINATDEWRYAIVLGTALALFVAWRLVPWTAGPLVVAGALFATQSLHSHDTNTSPLHPVQDTTEFNLAVEAANRALKPGDIALVSKDIGFYIRPHAKVVEGHDSIFRGDDLTARMIRENPRLTVFANGTFGPPVGTDTAAALEYCFAPSLNFNDLAGVRVRRPTPKC